MLKQFFLSNDGRLRAGWRIAAQTALQFILILALSLIAYVTGYLTVDQITPPVLLKSKVLETFAVVLSVIAARRFFDRKSYNSLGLHQERMYADLGMGVLIAGLMMSLIFLALFLFGWIEFAGFAWEFEPAGTFWNRTLTMLAIFLLVGYIEELQFRGYIFQNLEEGLNKAWAVALSSLIFSIAHLGNPDALRPMPVIGLLLAGIFFAYAYLRTRSLWLVIGLHFGWNFFINPVFGFAVRGLDNPGMLRHLPAGPEQVTGGAFGPEAGIILWPALLLGTALVYLYTRGRSLPGS